MKIERRILAQPIELRAAGEGAPRRLAGYAAVFNSPTEIAGLFYEEIAPGAFAEAVGRDDVRCLFNHNPDRVLGRNTAGTLTIGEDARGLQYDVEPPDTATGREVLTLVERGDVTGSSFTFVVARDKDGRKREEWREASTPGGLPTRRILEVRLLDVSPVTYPAYEAATVEARSAAAAVLAERGEDAGAVLQAHAADQAAGATLLRQKRQAIIEGTL